MIRAYAPPDAPAIARLFFEAVRCVNLKDYTPEQVRAWAPEVPNPNEWHRRMSGRLTLVAEEGGEVVAFAELEENGHLDRFYCRKDRVGRGVGKVLYRAVEREARALGISRLFAEASITARPFFERWGFTVLRERKVVVRGVSMANFAVEKVLLVSWRKTPQARG